MKKWLVCVVVIVGLALAACTDDNVSYETIEIDVIENKITEGYVVLDVREPDEFAAVHIPTAQSKCNRQPKLNIFCSLRMNTFGQTVPGTQTILIIHYDLVNK